jgi:chromosome segregation ATPase
MALSVLLRIVFVLVIGVGLGLLVYYGSVAFYQGWVRQSQLVQRNRALITILQERLDRERSLWEGNLQTLQAQVATLEAGLAELQETSDAHAETIATMDQAITHLDRRVGQNQQRIEQESLTLQAQLDTVNATLDDVQATAEAYAAKLETAETQIAALNAALESEQEISASAADAELRDDLNDALALEAQVATFEKRLILFQIAQDLLNARLLILEDSAQVAELLTETTTAHLDRAIDLMPAHAETLTEMRGRVLALNTLIAEGASDPIPELDALWTDLMALMAEVAVP